MIKACSWNQFDGEERRVCQQLDIHKEISLIDDFKCIETRCPYIYLRVENVTSLNKCAGNMFALFTPIIKFNFLPLYKFSCFHLYFYHIFQK